MNGVHDLGGQQNMGPVVYEKNEPVFHAPWEGRIYALDRAIRALTSQNTIVASSWTIRSISPQRVRARSASTTKPSRLRCWRA